MPLVLDSFTRLKTEGRHRAGRRRRQRLGSEPGARNDIAQYGICARAAEVPVVLIGDIDRGGVIASLVGTKMVIDADDAALVRGFLVNKFRGDPALFAAGNGDHRGVPPGGMRSAWCRSFPTRACCRPRMRWRSRGARPSKPMARARVAVPILPHIANFDDLDPLDAEPRGRSRARATGDGASRRRRSRHPAGLEGDHRRPRRVARGRLPYRTSPRTCAAAARSLGLCGGYQMLGRTVNDPAGIEGPAGTAEGLGLLAVETVLSADKRLEAVRGQTSDGIPFSGYEMHMGRDKWSRLRAAVSPRLADGSPRRRKCRPTAK